MVLTCSHPSIMAAKFELILFAVLLLVLSNDYQNSERHTFLFSLLYILGAVWRNNIELSVTSHRQLADTLLTDHQQLAHCWPTISGLLVCLSVETCQLTNGQQSVHSWLTGCFRCCFSQLPAKHFLYYWVFW